MQLTLNKKPINAFGNRMYDQEFARRLHQEADKTFWPMIGTVNQIAANATIDAYDLLCEHNLIRQAIKKPANRTIELWNRYQHHSKQFLGERWYLWNDVVNIASNNIQPDILKLHIAIKQVMDRYNVSDSDIRSAVHISQTLLELAVMFFDTFLDKFQSQTFLNISKDFTFARLIDMQKCWIPVTRHFSHYNGFINLNDDPNIKLAIEVILARFAKSDFINDAAGRAMHLNPDMAKYAPEEDKKYFKPE